MGAFKFPGSGFWIQKTSESGSETLVLFCPSSLETNNFVLFSFIRSCRLSHQIILATTQSTQAYWPRRAWKRPACWAAIRTVRRWPPRPPTVLPPAYRRRRTPRRSSSARRRPSWRCGNSWKKPCCR